MPECDQDGDNRVNPSFKTKHGEAMRYNIEHSRITTRYGVLDSVRRHIKVHTAFQCMGGVIKDIYINGVVRSYVCVNRRQIKNRKASFARQKERSELHTNSIRVRFKPMNSKVHRLKHRGKKTQHIQVTTY